MGKLYPPVIAGTIPAFCGTSIEVPFSMNRAVGISEFDGFALKIKKVSGTLVGTVIDNRAARWLEKKVIEFQLPAELYKELKAGEFYKIQIAYVKHAGTSAQQIGIYSTIGVVKYTTLPSVTIEGLDPDLINNHCYSYNGVYRQVKVENGKTDYSSSDTTEKLYSSRFVIYDSDNNIIKDSGEILHNTTYDTASYEATESFMIPEDLELNKIYYLYYIATTVNGYVKPSPRYRITQRRQIPMNLEASIKAELNYEAGTVQIQLIGAHQNQVASGQFLLSRRADSDSLEWEEVLYFSLQSEVPDRLLFTDYTVAQGVKYTYSLQQYNENRVFSDRIYSNSIIADFEDLFLFDGSRQLKVKFNPKVATFKTNVVESKTNTLGSKHPFITRNAHVNYKELSISGLISYQMDDIEAFLSKGALGLEFATHNLVTENIKAERDFKLAVLEWLNDGQPKLFRSPTEGNYIVRLMDVSMSPTDTLGRMLHTFTCKAYEIDDYNYDNLNKYGLLEVSNQIRYQMRWATVELAPVNEKGEVEYFTGQVNIGNNYGEMTLRPVYHINVSEMMPGTYFLVGESEENCQKIYIGTTGAYEINVTEPYAYVAIPEKDEMGNPVEWTGQITYGYKSQVTSLFDLITNVTINDIPCHRIMGYTGDSVLGELQDIKNTILAIKYVNFSLRNVMPLYVDENEFDMNDPSTWHMYADSNVKDYYYHSQKYPFNPIIEQGESVVPVNLDDLAEWNLYEIFFRRKRAWDLGVFVPGEDYYFDKEFDKKDPYMSMRPAGKTARCFYDPITKNIYKDNGDIFTINVNGEVADLSETERFKVTGIETYDILKAGPGVITDIGYQIQTSTYSFETNNFDIAGLKKIYTDARDAYLKGRGTQVLSSDNVKASYRAFINLLTEVVNKYKEENSIA